jgi:flagellar hook assembly protein FlgD
MRSLLLAAVFVLTTPVAAWGADVTMVARDVSLHASARSLAAASPRFDMVGLHWKGSGVPLFRTRSLSGRWSAWTAADDDWGRSGVWRMGSPDWTGPADAIQYHLRGHVTRLRAYFLWSPVERTLTRRLSIAGSPPIIPRLSWGADESIRRAAPQYAPTLQLAIVHHTVNSNDYTPQQSAAIVRGIEIYHVKANGWNDIGYNFIVDKYGQVFEGRFGGVDRNVVGAHSQGFNTGSVGVAVLGTYTNTPISPAAKASLERLLAWRLDLAHVDPLSTLNFLSGGNSRFPAGVPVFLRAISGHRDTYFTECPGNALYAQLPQIAHDVAQIGLPKLYSPLVKGTVGSLVRFTGRLSSTQAWQVSVADSTGVQVAAGTGTSANVDWTWDATEAVPGRYTWTMSAGPTVRSASGAIGSGSGATAPLAVTQLNASPSVVSPGGDPRDDGAAVSYRLTRPATVTGTLVDASGNTVATLFSGTRPAGSQRLTLAPQASIQDGGYSVVVTAQTSTTSVSASAPLTVDRTVDGFNVSTPVISPNGDGTLDSVTFAFTLAVPADVQLELQRGAEPVTTLESGELQPGAQSVTWDGSTPTGKAADGSYSAVLTVPGELGPITRTVGIAVDTVAPRVKAVSTRGLTFRVYEPSTVTLVAGARRFTKVVKQPGLVRFWIKNRPKQLSLLASDAAGNASTLRFR